MGQYGAGSTMVERVESNMTTWETFAKERTPLAEKD